MTFARFAIYFVPPAGEDWSRFATAWLGWNIETGAMVQPPAIEGLNVAAITETPRRYGLHATLKPPFRLRDTQTQAVLENACARLAASHRTVTLSGVEIARLGRFLALRPLGNTHALNTLAAACVRDLDGFRAPPTEVELARRRDAKLTIEQDANLTNWGYPYVLDAFRFHITLTGKLDKATLAAAETALDQHLSRLLPSPFHIRDLALVGETEDGRFHLIHRYALSA